MYSGLTSSVLLWTLHLPGTAVLNTTTTYYLLLTTVMQAGRKYTGVCASSRDGNDDEIRRVPCARASTYRSQLRDRACWIWEAECLREQQQQQHLCHSRRGERWQPTNFMRDQTDTARGHDGQVEEEGRR